MGRNPTTPTKGKAPTAEKLFKPFRTVRGNPYQFSLARRRTEGIFLSLVSVLALVFVLQKSGRIGEEISGVQCSYAATRAAPLLVITAFKDFGNQPTAFVNRHIPRWMSSSAMKPVCLSRHVIANGNEAEEYGRRRCRQSAAVVVWEIAMLPSEIHLTPMEWPAFELLISRCRRCQRMEGWRGIICPASCWARPNYRRR
jgi:hypothetical protein